MSLPRAFPVRLMFSAARQSSRPNVRATGTDPAARPVWSATAAWGKMLVICLMGVKGTKMHITLIILNCLASLASAAFACMAVDRPQTLSQSSAVSAGETFYAHMYAARSVPFGLAVGLLPFWYGGVSMFLLLFTAALVQGADVLIAAGRKKWSMAVGATVGLTIHAMCGFAIL